MSLQEILESSLAVAINEEQDEDKEAEVKISSISKIRHQLTVWFSKDIEAPPSLDPTGKYRRIIRFSALQEIVAYGPDWRRAYRSQVQ